MLNEIRCIELHTANDVTVSIWEHIGKNKSCSFQISSKSYAFDHIDICESEHGGVIIKNSLHGDLETTWLHFGDVSDIFGFVISVPSSFVVTMILSLAEKYYGTDYDQYRNLYHDDTHTI